MFYVLYHIFSFSYWGDFVVLRLLWCKLSKIKIFEDFVLIWGQWPQSYQKKSTH